MASVSPRYQAFIVDLLAPLSPLPRPMFHGGAMFALIVRDALYFRVDGNTRERFERAGSEPFSYTRQGRQVSLSAYYAVPEDLFDRPDELLEWARNAVAVARAAR